MKLYIDKIQIQEIIRHCREEFPDEACGILAGKAGRVNKIYRAANARKSSFKYKISAPEQLRIIRDIRSQDMDIVAVYHSHPNAPAYPSDRDLKYAFYLCSYLIISIIDGLAPLEKIGGGIKPLPVWAVSAIKGRSLNGIRRCNSLTGLTDIRSFRIEREFIKEEAIEILS
ncbi:MAG: M67 family metallopeptidase [Candidatus Omnitrophota bacterium]